MSQKYDNDVVDITLLSIIPADGWVARYQENGSEDEFTIPIACWVLIRETFSREYAKTNGSTKSEYVTAMVPIGGEEPLAYVKWPTNMGHKFLGYERE